MEQIKSLINAFLSFWDTYEGNATLFVFIILLFKLYINRKATSIDYKKTFVSIPGEITFLVMGFLLADMISANDATGPQNMTGIIIALILLIIQIAIEKEIGDKLSGKLSKGLKLLIALMYIMSIVLYIKVVCGGV